MSEITAFVDRVAEWAQRRADVRAVVLVGSAAREVRPADEWSDVDLILAVDATATFLESTGWLGALGHPLVTTVESTAIGGATERRVLFDDGMDVDFSVVDAELVALLPEFADDAQVRSLFGRGARIVYDEIGLSDALVAIPPPEVGKGPREAEYRALSNTFWYDAVWTAKKLRRGELLVAKASCDGQLLNRLVELMRWRTQLRHPDRDVWHGLRFAEEWLDPTDYTSIASAVTSFEAQAIAAAIQTLTGTFAEAETDLISRLGYPPAVPIQAIQSLLGSMLRPTPP